MEEIGLVKKVDNNQVEVEIDPSNSCGNCSSKSVCHLDANGTKRILIVNSDIKVDIGDLIQVELKARNAIFSAFIIFILPLLFLGVGYIYGSHFGQGWGIVASFIGLGIGLLSVHKIDKWFGKKKSFQPFVSKLLQKCPLPDQI